MFNIEMLFKLRHRLTHALLTFAFLPNFVGLYDAVTCDLASKHQIKALLLTPHVAP